MTHCRILSRRSRNSTLLLGCLLQRRKKLPFGEESWRRLAVVEVSLCCRNAIGGESRECSTDLKTVSLLLWGRSIVCADPAAFFTTDIGLSYLEAAPTTTSETKSSIALCVTTVTMICRLAVNRRKIRMSMYRGFSTTQKWFWEGIGK